MVVLWGELSGSFCGVFFWGGRGEGRIFVEAKMLKGRWVKGSEFILVIFHPTGWPYTSGVMRLSSSVFCFFLFFNMTGKCSPLIHQYSSKHGQKIVFGRLQPAEVMNRWQPWSKRRIPVPMPWWICGASLISWKRWAFEKKQREKKSGRWSESWANGNCKRDDLEGCHFVAVPGSLRHC